MSTRLDKWPKEWWFITIAARRLALETGGGADYVDSGNDFDDCNEDDNDDFDDWNDFYDDGNDDDFKQKE